MGYTVFARKYRPQRFDDLVGQEHVTRTLENAIKSERVAHAFLFTGVRGVGKTSCARILAKALNCAAGPTDQPCNTCPQCSEITRSMDLDVLEMDGASNNSVDDVRRLQESIPYRPSRDRHKVVIVDEVHMLSAGAFNAFLKTLEEPPPHVKFIFATPEAHKVPVTIRSRCQRYDFRLIPQAVIAARVGEILKAEGIDADADAIGLVAREASGSMRDALTLLDQVVAFSDGSLRGREVAEQLGIAEHSHVRALAEATLGGDAARALEVIDQIATQGIDFLHFTKQWLDLLRDLVVLRVAGDRPRLVDLPQEALAAAQELSAAHDPLELQRTFSSVSQLVEDVGGASAPRAVLEMGAVRLATRPRLLPMAEVLARLSALERGGRSPTRGPGPPSEGPGRTRREAPGPVQRAPSQEAQAGAPTVGPGPSGALDLPELPPHSAEAAKATRPVASDPAPHTTRAAPAAPSSPEGPGATEGGATDPRWRAVIAHMRNDNPMWAAMFEHGVASMSGDTLTLSFLEGSFFGSQAQSPPALEALSSTCRAVLGKPLQTIFRMAESEALDGVTFAQEEAAAVDERHEEIKRRARSHPRVRQALEVFPELGRKVEVQIDD